MKTKVKVDRFRFINPTGETMAKKKAATKTADKPANGSQAVKMLLAEGLTSPSEIVTKVKEMFGFDVKTSLVSNLKSTTGKGKKTKGRKAKATANGEGNIQTALAFIKQVGGLDQAKQTISLIEQIKNA